VNRSDKLAREYNLFGPWLLQVQGEPDIPDIFLPHCRISDAEFAFKIPRRVERRNARPGDALYDYLILLQPDEMTVLERRGNEVVRRGFTYREIVALIIDEELLKGDLTVLLADGVVTAPFNTVSEDIIRQTVELLRRKITGNAPPRPLPSARYPVEQMDQLFRNLYRKETTIGTPVLLAYQPFASLDRQTESVWSRTVDLVRRPALRSGMVIATDHDLVLYRSQPQIVTYRRGNYGYSRIIVPYHQIRGMSTSAVETYVGCRAMAFQVPGHALGMTITEEFDLSAVSAFGNTFGNAFGNSNTTEVGPLNS
jgi:hypothetical protein